MKKTLIKILKISQGVSQLFCAMDKGFRRVESDIELIKEFRYLCYQASENIEAAHNDLSKIIRECFKNDHHDTEEIPEKLISKCLQDVRFILEENIIAITNYIDDYASVWKKTLSINALNKFKSLLEKEYKMLDKEVERFLMELKYNERTNILSKPRIADTKKPNY